MHIRVGTERRVQSRHRRRQPVLETIGLTDVQTSDAHGLKWARMGLESAGQWAVLLCDDDDQQNSNWVEVAADQAPNLSEACAGPQAELEFQPGGPLVVNIFGSDGQLSATLEASTSDHAIRLRDSEGHVLWQAK